jgi:hypothetical protein
VTIGGQFDLRFGKIPGPVVENQIDDLKEPGMYSGFAADYADSFPFESPRMAFFQKVTNLPQRHVLVRGLLLARAIAVETVQIAEIGDVYFDQIAGPRKFKAENACYGGFRPQEQHALVCVRQHPAY